MLVADTTATTTRRVKCIIMKQRNVVVTGEIWEDIKESLEDYGVSFETLPPDTGIPDSGDPRQPTGRHNPDSESPT